MSSRTTDSIASRTTRQPPGQVSLDGERAATLRVSLDGGRR
jgi:hypothetical protein